MATLTGAIIRALFTCAATEKMRFALNGVRVEPSHDGKGTLLLATDGRRLIRLAIPTNGTGKGFLTAEHAKAMKAGDVVTIIGDTVTIHGTFAVVSKLAGSEHGNFPETAQIFSDRAPWVPAADAPPVRRGFNPILLGDICAAIAAIISEPTIDVFQNGAKPMLIHAHGFATWAKHDAAMRAASQLGIDREKLPDVGRVTVDAALMPLVLS